MLTVNSPLRDRNSFVPSSGSTSQKRPSGGVVRKGSHDSSAIVGMSGESSASAAQITFSARWSASVTGEPSSFVRTSNRVSYTAST